MAFILATMCSLFAFNNLRSRLRGRPMEGKIAKRVGPIGHFTLSMVGGLMMIVGTLEKQYSLLSKAGVVLLLILAADNFFNGNDPPKRKRRQWIRNRLAKLALVKAD